jgi:hypothetical protein
LCCKPRHGKEFLTITVITKDKGENRIGRRSEITLQFAYLRQFKIR